MLSKKRFNVIVAGAGPAGMMAAIRAAHCGASVLLLDRNPVPGRKLLITGKGRCNLTNACGREEFIKRFYGKGDFLRDAFKIFFNEELIEFFESRGLLMKTERQERVFPVTDKAQSVLDVLLGEIEKRGIRLGMNRRIRSLGIKDGCVDHVGLGGGQKFLCDKLILASGGEAYPGTGSDGAGLKWAEQAGHRITEPVPALVPLNTGSEVAGAFEGLTLKNIRLCFRAGKRRLQTAIGELLFTADGISGPLVLTASGEISGWLKRDEMVSVEIDLKPALSNEQLDARILREIKESPTKKMQNLLQTLLPAGMAPVLMHKAGLDPEKKAHSLSKQDRKSIAAELKAFKLIVKDNGSFRRAMVTRGGVSTRDINPRTMESWHVCGLYFAGEIIDIDGDTGGFNLQAAFSTGYLAGESAAKAVKEF